MIVCPKCGKVVSYNSYFGAYICTVCNWEDASKGEKRNRGTAFFYRTLPSKKASNSKEKVDEKKMAYAK